MSDRAELPGSLISRRHLVIGGVLAAASGVAFARRPEVARPIVRAEVFESWVPHRFGRWAEISESGVILPPPDATRDRLYDNLVTRVYAAPGGTSPVMLLLAYNNAQDGVLQVHRPETCYPVGGFVISPTQDIRLPLDGRNIPANAFTARSPNRLEQVLYFTRLGSAFPRNWGEQRLAVINANLRKEIPDGMMMRISVLSMPSGPANAELTQFAQAFFDACPQPLRRLLIAQPDLIAPGAKS